MKFTYNSILSLLSIAILSACANNNNREPIVHLDTKADLLTVVNMMKPSAQDKASVLTLLSNGIEETMAHQEGYISSSVHSSLDNDYVINYSQWKNMESLGNAGALVQAGKAPKMAEAFTKGKADYHPVTLVAQFTATPNTKVAIDKEGKLLTIINILTPKAGTSKEELVSLMKDAVSQEVVTQSGFVSSTLLQSMDNNYVINYAQWKDEASLQGMVNRLQAGNAPKLAEAFSMATPDFHPFKVNSSHFKK